MSIVGALGGEAIAGIVKTVGDTIDDLYTSDEERAAGELESKKVDAQLLLGQQDINKEEAKHASILVAGWRPAIGWVCAQALWFAYIPKAVVMTAVWVYAAWKVVAQWSGIGVMPALPPFPDFGVMDIIGLVGTMLGMATLRHRETMNGVAREEPLSPLPKLFKRKPAAGQEEAP